jgi:HD superfamily phosphohydrolase
LDLDTDLDRYVSESLDNYNFYKVDRRKILYDAVLGTHELSPLEVSIIDSPFVQRLRGIHQTSLAFLTFPSARHSRFEHSIGVSIMADRMGTALNKYLIKFMSLKEIEIGIKELRIAGILHDIGHGPFSHTSEDIIAQLPSIKKMYEKNEFKKLKPHELIAFKLLNSGSFKDFFNNLLKIYDEEELSLNII